MKNLKTVKVADCANFDIQMVGQMTNGGEI